eukprot:6213116-Pleurochrysis_carterae.AAC.3
MASSRLVAMTEVCGAECFPSKNDGDGRRDRRSARNAIEAARERAIENARERAIGKARESIARARADARLEQDGCLERSGGALALGAGDVCEARHAQLGALCLARAALAADQDRLRLAGTEAMVRRQHDLHNTHAHAHAHAHTKLTHAHAHGRAHSHTHAHAHAHTCTRTRAHVYTQSPARTHMWTHVRVHAHAHAHACTVRTGLVALVSYVGSQRPWCARFRAHSRFHARARVCSLVGRAHLRCVCFELAVPSRTHVVRTTTRLCMHA